MKKLFLTQFYFIFLFFISIERITEINNEINIEEFNETQVIKKLRQKQRPKKTEVIDVVVNEETNEQEEKPKQTRGRKRKYNTEEERIQARRIQQKAYRERKKKELEELKKKVEVMNE